MACSSLVVRAGSQDHSVAVNSPHKEVFTSPPLIWLCMLYVHAIRASPSKDAHMRMLLALPWQPPFLSPLQPHHTAQPSTAQHMCILHSSPVCKRRTVSQANAPTMTKQHKY